MKRSQIDRAIETLEAERAVLDLAIAKLRQQQTRPTAAVPARIQKTKRSSLIDPEHG